jgi:hypothetical protein
MLKKPKHFPVYVASYLDMQGNIYEATIISKISKVNEKKWDRWTKWENIKIEIETIDYANISENNIRSLSHSCFSNTIGNDDAKLVPKDEWIKIVDKYNKLIDETNKKEGSSIKRVSY